MTEPAAARPMLRCWFIGPVNLLAAAIARLPQRLLLAAGAALTWLLWPLLGKRRRYAKINIDLCFPELDAAARRRLLKANLRATVTGALELVRGWYAPPAALGRLVAQVDGLEHLRAARAAGHGVLLFGGHFPHSELCARLLGEALGERVSIVARSNNHPCIERLLDGARRRAFADVIGKKDVRGLLRTLSQGGIVAYSADQNFNYQHAFVPFFGIPAATLTATPDLARRGKAMVLPFWFHRDADGRYRLRIEPTWPGWPSGDPVTDAARYMAELETVVRQHPEQYLWVHRRFKTRPPGEGDVYRNR
ncbi:lipid A biosynthesis lauroyl acyltransferase [Pseudoxanthomonas kalamensis DSM 18571]|uniref:lysophospholipid acyltransferase family protein n=1 Tax=Pseudoxanthomonas kalamensis TaxID=289483 RepID=UPI00139113A1|nr:lipid A biosynthesis lauroyl acyltransferase [Pseudoxanthomonas kalamensis]KAF1712008.1 lipid A biosynthesis lauroyl acyltransferase [Pseudoxanthomonas kalamensis DSM 18571]